MSIPINSPDFVGRLPISRILLDHPFSTKNLLISRFSKRSCNLKINQFCSRIFFMGRKKIAGERIFSKLAALMKSLLCIAHSNASSKRSFFMVRKIVTENRTSLHNDTVSALLNRKLNCNRSAAGFKPSKVGLNAAQKPAFKYNQAHKS